MIVHPLPSEISLLEELHYVLNGKDVIRGTGTIVVTGNTPFPFILSHSLPCTICFDALLVDLTTYPEYSVTNSYHASVRLSSAIDTIIFNHLSDSQLCTREKQIKVARERGLLGQYWSTPAWPVSVRNGVRKALSEKVVGLLNIDGLWSATKWDWGICVVAGLEFCRFE